MPAYSIGLPTSKIERSIIIIRLHLASTFKEFDVRNVLNTLQLYGRINWVQKIMDLPFVGTMKKMQL